MLSFPILTRSSAALLALVSLVSVGCGAGDSERSYSSGMDAEFSSMEAELTATGGCEEGAVQSCKIYLGEHGDLNNCIFGLSVCSHNGWSSCVDEDSMNDNPELYAELLTDGEER